MPRRPWDEVPVSVRSEVDLRCGAVLSADPAPSGANCSIAHTLHLNNGERVFCKGIELEQAGPWTRDMFERESHTQALPSGLAPRLLWQFQLNGWWLLGFEHIAGEPADFSPRSPDLPRVAAVVSTMARQLDPSPIAEAQTFGHRLAQLQIWSRYRDDLPEDLPEWAASNVETLASFEAIAPHMIAGGALLHTDLNAGNWLISPSAVQIIDWSWYCTGAAWVERELLGPRLVAAGHSPAAAARWIGSIATGEHPSDKARAALAAAIAGIWTHRNRQGEFRPDLAEAALGWARHLGQHRREWPT